MDRSLFGTRVKESNYVDGRVIHISFVIPTFGHGSVELVVLLTHPRWQRQQLVLRLASGKQ